MEVLDILKLNIIQRHNFFQSSASIDHVDLLYVISSILLEFSKTNIPYGLSAMLLSSYCPHQICNVNIYIYAGNKFVCHVISSRIKSKYI